MLPYASVTAFLTKLLLISLFSWSSYCISKSLAGEYGVALTAAHLPLKDSVSSGNTNLRRVILDAGRFQVSFFKLFSCVISG